MTHTPLSRKTVYTFDTADQALQEHLAASRLGYTVVLHGCVLTIFHKA